MPLTANYLIKLKNKIKKNQSTENTNKDINQIYKNIHKKYQI